MHRNYIIYRSMAWGSCVAGSRLNERTISCIWYSYDVSMMTLED